MKSITRILTRLVLVFLMLVASSMMFFSSPAVAATSSPTLLTLKNFETEVLASDKPVIAILVPGLFLENQPNYLENLKTKAQQFYGDKYKVVTGKIEENPQIIYQVPPIGVSVPKIAAYEDGYLIGGAILALDDSTPSFEFLKTQLGKA